MDPDDPVVHELDRECRVFCEYLLGEEPDAYVAAKYRAANLARKLCGPAAEIGFEAFLLRLARRGGLFTGMVDTFTGVFGRCSVFRKKMTMLVAILESCGSLHDRIGSAVSGSKTALFLRLTLHGLGFAVSLLLSAAILFPCRVYYGMSAVRSSGVTHG
jgi:hypothetical protein